MGVHTKGEAGVGMAKVFGEFLHRYATGQHDARVVMPKLVQFLLAGGGVAASLACILVRCRDVVGSRLLDLPSYAE